jgi:hypothetical protein
LLILPLRSLAGVDSALSSALSVTVSISNIPTIIITQMTPDSGITSFTPGPTRRLLERAGTFSLTSLLTDQRTAKGTDWVIYGTDAVPRETVELFLDGKSAGSNLSLADGTWSIIVSSEFVPTPGVSTFTAMCPGEGNFNSSVSPPFLVSYEPNPPPR